MKAKQIPGQFEVFWVALDPVHGSEMRKTRPCVVVSPDVMNRYLKTVIVAPVTSTFKDLPFRISVTVSNKPGSAALDQIRSVDKSRLRRKMADLTQEEARRISLCLVEMFMPEEKD